MLPPPARWIRLFLFAGIFAGFLAVYKGDGGYRDLQCYLDDAQHLWLRADLRVLKADGTFGYNRFVLGLPFVSAPLVWIGHLLAFVSPAINERSIIALAVPLLGAL